MAQRSRSDEKKRPLLSGRCYYEQKNRYFKRKSAQKRKYVGSCQGLYEGAENAGHTVTEFFLDSMNIHGCKGCFGGKSSLECPCVQKDDMDKIYTSVKNCDVIVLATPLYYWNMSGQIRTAIDRLFALEEGAKTFCVVMTELVRF